MNIIHFKICCFLLSIGLAQFGMVSGFIHKRTGVITGPTNNCKNFTRGMRTDLSTLYTQEALF